MGGYYSYLPAIHIYDDLEFDFMTKKGFDKFEFVARLPDSTQVNRYSIGPAVLLTPSFLIGDKLARQNPIYENDGISMPYKKAVLLSTILFVAIGFFFIRNILLHYFSDFVVMAVILSIGGGTNLLYYSSHDAVMSHSYSFFLFAALLWATFSWLEKGNRRALPFLGIVMGLIACVRLPNLVIGVIPLLWGIRSWEDISRRGKLLIEQKWWIFASLIMFVIGYFPQLMYYKTLTGHWFVNAYDGYKFWFDQPLFWRLMFSFRNGWLIYSPIMGFSLLGLYFIWKHYRFAFWSLTSFLILNIYILSSWWCWWYLGFGMRAMIESAALLSLPMAACYHYWLKNKILKWLFVPILGGFIYLNFFQTDQYLHGIIRYDGMNWPAYKLVFGQPHPVKPELMHQRDSLIDYNLNIYKAIHDKKYRWEMCK